MKTDILELYSFVIYLHFYSFFYIFLFKQSFLEIIFINLLYNFGLYFLFNYSIFNFIFHNYWNKRLYDIALPQTVSTLSNILLYTRFKFIGNNYDYTLIIPSNLLTYFIIKKIFKKEINESKNLRYIQTILFFFIRYFFT